MLKLVLKEITHRAWNFTLSALAVAATVAIFTAYHSTAEASRRETIRVTRDIGFNLRIIPRSTDMDQFWTDGFSDQTMPQEAVEKFVQYKNVFLAYNHLVASLQQRYMVRGRSVILTGLAPAVTAPDQKKAPMGFNIKPGTALVGHETAERLGLKKGGALELDGRRFEVVQVLAESGTDDDVRVYVRLEDAQALLGKPGRINEIKAIDCLCLTSDQNPLAILKAELEKALPEARVLQVRSIADARAKQRQTVDRYIRFVTPVLVVAGAVWIGVLAFLNVRERRAEIGVLRALGYRSGSIAFLFLGRAVLLGAVGALTGYALGTALALRYGPEIFQVTAKSIQAEPALLTRALWAAPLYAALATLIPAALAVTQDPATTLREE